MARARELWESLKASFDGCTMAPDFDIGETCCNLHDYDYATHDVGRAEADADLRRCMQAAGHPVLAWVYWGAVRVGGWWFWNRGRGMRVAG
jgi:hypothetical protein